MTYTEIKRIRECKSIDELVALHRAMMFEKAAELGDQLREEFEREILAPSPAASSPLASWIATR